MSVELIPEEPILSRQTYAAPLSFVGSTRRATAWVRRVGTNWPKAALAASLVAVVLPVVWLFLIAWYVVVFGFFGIVTIPFRLVRRHQRKALAVQKAQLATMQAMMARQSEAMAQMSQEPIVPTPPQPELPPASGVDEVQDLRNWM
jgi:Flp pilus assembly protein TadB